MSLVHLHQDGCIAVIEIRNPPVNALSQAVRQGLLDAFKQARNTAGTKAIVLYGAERTFIAGADIKEFGQPPRAPLLPEICTYIENSPLPVIAALHGSPLGGGLEVALAAHFRIAHSKTRMGLPEVRLGLLPGAGGTQRLPRLIPLADAISMITTGRDINAAQAEQLGLLDQIFYGEDPAKAGVTFARTLVSQGIGPRPTRARPAPQPAPDLFENARVKLSRTAKGQIAPLQALKAIEGACHLPFDKALQQERALFMELMASDQRAALIHAFFAEKRSAKRPDLAGAAQRPLSRIGIVGGGTMGVGIAAACLLAGWPVDLVEQNAKAAASARQAVLEILKGACQRGKLQEADFATTCNRFHAGSDDTCLSRADLVIEAVFEDMAAKRDVFKRLDQLCKPDAILATNTSYLDVDRIAAQTRQPARVLGLHFFSPAHIMRLLEVVIGRHTAPDVAATGFALAKRLGKIAVGAGVCDGFIGNRILARYRKALDGAVLAGASPYQVDQALEAFGLAMGPYAAMDLAGLDIAWANRKRLAPTRHPDEVYADFADTLCEAGQFGRKAGRGFYLYDGTPPVPNPDLSDILQRERACKGLTPRDMTDDEIVTRFMAAMINEAARVVAEGIAARPSDVDVTLINGYGFPRWRGGPMHYADHMGLPTVLKQIERLSGEDPVFWQPAPLLVKLARSGQSFNDLN